MVSPIPDYKNLDLSGEARQAAARMEARAREPASQAMFAALVEPLLPPGAQRALEFGCGTAGWSRKLARHAPQLQVFACDKSEHMLAAARHHIQSEGLSNLALDRWDVLDEAAFPFGGQPFDLILSSVVMPYLDDAQSADLVGRLAARLAPGGVLAFVEQDWGTDTLYYPDAALAQRMFNREDRVSKRSLGLGLRPLLREAGLQVLPRRSFLWTDDAYGAYTRELLERFADSAHDQGRVSADQAADWKQTLLALAESGDFYYGLVYHCAAGQRPAILSTR